MQIWASNANNSNNSFARLIFLIYNRNSYMTSFLAPNSNFQGKQKHTIISLSFQPMSPNSQHLALCGGQKCQSIYYLSTQKVEFVFATFTKNLINKLSILDTILCQFFPPTPICNVYILGTRPYLAALRHKAEQRC